MESLTRVEQRTSIEGGVSGSPQTKEPVKTNIVLLRQLSIAGKKHDLTGYSLPRIIVWSNQMFETVS